MASLAVRITFYLKLYLTVLLLLRLGHCSRHNMVCGLSPGNFCLRKLAIRLLSHHADNRRITAVTAVFYI